MMIDIVFPKDNENEFIRLAEKLGLEGLCFVYTSPKDISQFQKLTKLKLSSAILCAPEDVRKFKGRITTIVSAPDDQTKLRHIIEQARPDIIFNLEFAMRKDFMHHRASGLNHIMATIAREKDVAIGLNFAKLLELRPLDRALCMGRMQQNIHFARKFKFRCITASFARDPWQMRAEREIISFFTCLGADTGILNTAISKVSK
jgi:RNase P/RNase MRP subunit p30